jgi:4,5-DOPA dioxygenase extradiol
MNRLPVLFAGHGSPMNAIEDNPFSRSWTELGKRLPRPEAILSVSAHWFTSGTRVSDTPAPKMVYDMYGFPDALYKVQYPAPGSPRVAGLVRELLGDGVQIDNAWGLDHGTWSVLRRLYPLADVPVVQLSVDRHASMQEHFAMGEALRPLRERGVLIFGSGNIVHNLARVSWDMDGGYPWADAFDAYIKRSILSRDFESAIRYEQAGPSAAYAFESPDHYAPLLYVLGAADARDEATVFNEARVNGSISMTSYLFAGRK